eukprot:6212570-Pleurochrysis_carterae.AAC.3
MLHVKAATVGTTVTAREATSQRASVTRLFRCLWQRLRSPCWSWSSYQSQTSALWQMKLYFEVTWRPQVYSCRLLSGHFTVRIWLVRTIAFVCYRFCVLQVWHSNCNTQRLLGVFRMWVSWCLRQAHAQIILRLDTLDVVYTYKRVGTIIARCQGVERVHILPRLNRHMPSSLRNI